MADLMASGTNPGTTYTISPPTDPGVNHEDRVVVTTVGGVSTTQMFRVSGALFTPGTGWTFQSGVSTAYATVQNPDGSIHYFTYSGAAPWQTEDWQGSNNNTIYNAVDFGATGGGSATDNNIALTALFTAMTDAAGGSRLGGGMARIPQFNFPVNAASPSTGTPLAVPDQAIIQGLGTGGSNAGNNNCHFSISDTGSGKNTFWKFSNTGSSGGTYLRNLAFQWVTPGNTFDTCLDFENWNDGAQECTFTDCPMAINLNGLAGFAKACTITYGAHISTPANVTGIVVQGNQNEISGPSEMNGGSLSGTSTFLLLGGGVSACEHNTIRSIHIFGWNYGIDYSDINGVGITGGTSNNVIDGCKLDCIITCINLVPIGTNGQIFNQVISNNEMTKSRSSTDGHPIVYIASKSETAPSNVGPIFLVNNLIYSNVTSADMVGGHAQANQYGVQIATCEAVSIIGGQISNVGTNAGSDGTANICISGDPISVIISDVDLAASYAGVNSGNSTGTNGSAASEFALLISGNPSYVQVDNCYMGGGWAGRPVSVTGSPGKVHITNCVGYNDQNTPLNGAVAPLSALSAATCSTPYFGPSVFTWTNSTPVTVHVFGTTYTASSGIIFLPSPYDTIFVSAAPLLFSWIGK